MSQEAPNPIQLLNGIFNNGRRDGIAQQVDEGEIHRGRTISLHGKETVNLGSCGYMGLEFDERVMAGGIEALRAYGMEFSSSRAFLSNPLYPQLEDLLERIFLRPTLAAPTTTLLHLSALPVLIGPDDVALLDQQVHSSVQLSAKVLRANGVQVDFVPHNSIARIERKIKSYKDTKKKIWYLGDGVYSMYGDFSPVAELGQLLDRYEQFHLYLDDAHGMSWTGQRGRGYVAENISHPERLFVAISLAKGFGTGGGAIVCPDAETKQTIRNCGGTQIFGGPMQPPILGAAVASAKLHLSPEFPAMQAQLQELNRACTEAMESLPLPLVSAPGSPVRFLGIGGIEPAQKIVRRIIESGFWMNVAQYPAIAPNHSGLRFMMTRMLTPSDIGRFAETVKGVSREVLGDGEEVYQQIWKAFSKEYRYSLANG